LVVQRRLLLQLRKLDPEMLISTRVLSRLTPRGSCFIHIPGIFIHIPGIRIHILPESLFTSLRNPYSHRPEYAAKQEAEPLASQLKDEDKRFRALAASLQIGVWTGTIHDFTQDSEANSRKVEEGTKRSLIRQQRPIRRNGHCRSATYWRTLFCCAGCCCVRSGLEKRWRGLTRFSYRWLSCLRR
jgi:hypothetical protein